MSLRRNLVLAAAALFIAPPLVGQAESRPLGAPKPFPYDYRPTAPAPEELRARRAALARAVGDGVVILLSEPGRAISAGGRYKPSHNIYYFTGVPTDFCALILEAEGGAIASETLFLPRYDAMYEAWDGKRVLADDAAKAATGVQKIVPVPSRGFGAFGKAVDEALAASKKLYLEGDASPAGRREEARFDLETPSRADALASYAAAKKPDVEITSIARAIDAVRGVKSPYEIEMVRRAIRATGDGFVRAMRKARPGMWEFEFDAILQHAFVDAGATGLPYYPIVATGENACSMHYVANRTRFEDGDLVLCDAAAEWEWYASDITRTFPCNGKFTPAQRAAYEGVLRGQEAAAKALRPGTSLMELNRIARDAMEKAGLKQAYMHQYILGHQVGLNVHDAGGARFKPGMIITIEPGYYVKSEKFGIRIEDCYLVTEDGSECLSADIPKTVAEIEALVGADYR